MSDTYDARTRNHVRAYMRPSWLYHVAIGEIATSADATSAGTRDRRSLAIAYTRKIAATPATSEGTRRDARDPSPSVWLRYWTMM
jgi:hypothetical protein